MAQPPSPIGLRGMRRIATGVLVAATIVYLVTGFIESEHAWVEFVRAFAEASMVGALADWFAVTALFRHPLGLPIPHTAVIPKSKERIGQGLGRFVEENFLAPSVIAEKLQSTDIAGSIARWMTSKENSAVFSSGARRVLQALAGALSEDDVQLFLRSYVAERIERIKLSPLAGNVLAHLMVEQRHQAAVAAMLQKAAELVRDYESEMRRIVHERSSWFWRRTGISERLTERLIAVIEETLRKAAEDPEHVLRKRIEEALALLAARLKDSPQFLETGERLKARFLEHPAFNDYLRAASRDLLAKLTTQAAQPDSVISPRIATITLTMAEAVLVDPALRAELNRLARAAVTQLFLLQRFQVAQLISETVDQWDAEMLSGRLEAAIGRDLQYIRINGALVGGLVGVLIHSVNTWLHP